MVYCGKASQGCQSCRIRRIKCDKLKPDCSQCIRVGKKCPGYRDQLSLMFRDESNKVIQKAHAQWGVGEDNEASSSSRDPGSDHGLNDPSSTKSPTALSVGSQASTTQSFPSPPAAQVGSRSLTTNQHPVETARLQSSLTPTLEEQGFQFYVNRYLVKHPDEPRNTEELKSYEWLWTPALRDASAALGLASLSNLRGDHELMLDARRRYGNALRTAGQLIESNSASTVDLTSRLVVLLAMFELVKGTQLGTGSVYNHVSGGAALIRTRFPLRVEKSGGLRALLQLCYSTFLAAYEVGVPLPAMFNDWVSFCQRLIPPQETPATNLGLLIARFIEIASYIRFNFLRDGKTTTSSTVEKLVNMEGELKAWEGSLDGYWCYKTETATHLPPEAVFEGEYHVYHDMWVARIWNHYRWARILVNQLILELVEKNPASSQPLVPADERQYHFETMKKLARDTLVSTPSHWRHPLLGEMTPMQVEQTGGAGAGAAGIPILLFQLKVAACAPAIPQEYWNWSYGNMECIWGDMGMHHAKLMMDTLLAHRDSVQKATPGSLLAVTKEVWGKAA